MGKIRTRILGFEDIEKEQKEASKRRAAEKKVLKSHEESDDEVQAPAAKVEVEHHICQNLPNLHAFWDQKV